MSSSELQALFSSLKPRSRDPSSSVPVSHATPRPTSTSLFSDPQAQASPPPPFSTVNEDMTPRFSTNGIDNQLRQPSSSTAQNLLKLLNHGTTQSENAGQSENSSAPLMANNPTISASDLVARFMSPTGSKSYPTIDSSSNAPHIASTQTEIHGSRNPLLELLNRQSTASAGSRTPSQTVKATQSPTQVEGVSEATPPKGQSVERSLSPARQFGSKASRESTPFEAPKASDPVPPAGQPIFTYQNPFEALQASRGQVKPSSPAPPQPATPSFAFAGTSSPTTISARKKLTPKLRSQRSGTSPQPETAQEHYGSPTAADHPQISLAFRDKQPTIETPGVAQSIEIAEDDANIKQELTGSNGIPEAIKDGQDGSGEWEDVPEKTASETASTRIVPVYNFPIKAFVSITLQLGPRTDVAIREDGVMEISRLKKDFDQLDRSLAAATSRYITYAFTKNGGLRIIRQDDGSDRHVFKHSHDRVFNVAFCTTAAAAAPTDHQAVLGTGISGTVYYATVSKEGNDLFEKNQLESESLIFPPWPQGDENTAGGVLKTRAKRSSRHPDFFAIGRGKSIHLVWPATAMTPRYGVSDTNRTVDVEKLYQDRPLQISTGKAGKDFVFSEDDTVIVSLDKTGRLRFWDIRSLVDETNATAPRVNPVNVDTPILSLSTASPAEKSWPTSVLFVDKARPYNKGGPQRYVLVGLRQNHTLQLWDIALGKAVQELNFPHENETDGICSVNYHPNSGIIVVGHPTRNSIFFVHLSVPKYALGSALTQANYVERSAGKEPALHKPESTACMSGIREISFAPKGELRSIELLPVQKSSDGSKTPDESTLQFELYIVHSKGVTCLGISKEDLGWNAEGKVVQSIDALKEGLVTVKDLKLGSVIEEPARSKSPVKEIQQPSKNIKKKVKKTNHVSEEIANAVDEIQQPTPLPEPVPNETAETPLPEPPMPESRTLEQEPPLVKESKKSKKKAAQAADVAIKAEPRSVSPTKTIPAQTNGKFSDKPHDSREDVTPETETVVAGITIDMLAAELKKVEHQVSGALKDQLDTLHESIRSDRATQDQISNSRQETVLRLVSDSLTNNVEKSLTRIVSQQIQQSVIPVVAQSSSAEIGSTMSKSLHHVIPQEMSKHLPEILSTVLQTPQITHAISASIAQKLAEHLESQLSSLVVQTVTPLFKNLATVAAEQATADTEARLGAQIQQMQLQHADDNEKIDKLSQVLQGMANTLQAMSDSQVAFQGQILKERREMSTAESSIGADTSRQVSTIRVSASPAIVARPVPVKVKSKEEIERDEIAASMNGGMYEEATIKWLQSSQPAQLFDDVFIRFTPDYLAHDVSPLVAFSVAITIGNSLNTNIDRRMEWISTAFDAVDPADPELVDLAQHAPALISSLIQKLESLYMTLAEHDPSNSVLRHIPALAKKARDMKAMFSP